MNPLRKFSVFLSLCAVMFLWLTWPVFSARISALKTANPSETALMRLRKKQAQARGKDFRPLRQWVSIQKVSPALQKAVLAAEDDGFYRHNGVEWQLLRRALIHDLKQRRWSRGASTITQQLAKNLYLSPSKNPLRKVRELLIAFRLEKQLSKTRILEIYLNVVEWGNGVFGIEAAAQTYFGKSAAELGWEESIALAAVLPSPRKHKPVDESRWVTTRRSWVRQRLRDNRWLPEEPLSVTADTVRVSEVLDSPDFALEEDESEFLEVPSTTSVSVPLP